MTRKVTYKWDEVNQCLNANVYKIYRYGEKATCMKVQQYQSPMFCKDIADARSKHAMKPVGKEIWLGADFLREACSLL